MLSGDGTKMFGGVSKYLELSSMVKVVPLGGSTGFPAVKEENMQHDKGFGENSWIQFFNIVALL